MNIDAKTVAMIVVASAVAIAALILVVYGVTNHTEAGLMSVCWDENGRSNADLTTCETPEELVWDKETFPLTVDGPVSATEIPDAIDLINDQVGCTVMLWEPDSHENADVLVVLDEALLVGTHMSGSTEFTRTETGVMHAIVRTYNVTDPYLRQRTIVHELGHVLGLDHDDFDSSIMFTENPAATADMDFIRFTDSDTARLRGLYCND